MSELEQDRQTSGDSDSDLLRRSYLPGMVVTSLSRMREQETAEPSAVQIAIAESVERLEEQSDVTKLRREVESVASEGLWIGQYPPSAILLAYATRIFELDRAATSGLKMRRGCANCTVIHCRNCSPLRMLQRPAKRRTGWRVVTLRPGMTNRASLNCSD